MLKMLSVLALAVTTLVTSGSEALGQLYLCPGTPLGGEKVPVFPDSGSANAYLVLTWFTPLFTIESRDCCIGGDTWKITAFSIGFPPSLTVTTAPEDDPPPLSCTLPPTNQLGTVFTFFLPTISLVIVQPEATPSGFPAHMFLRICFVVFPPLFPGLAVQVLGSDACFTSSPAQGMEEVQQLQVDSEAVKQLEALEPLRASGDIDALIQLIQHDPSEVVRTGAAIVLSEFRDTRVVEALVEASKDPHAWVRIAAVTVLRHLREERIGGRFEKASNPQAER